MDSKQVLRSHETLEMHAGMQLSKPMFKNLLTALQLIDAEAELVAADNGISTFVSSESTYSIFRLNWNSSIGLHLLWFFPSTKDI